MAEVHLCRVTALLASGPGQPAGDTRTGLELVVCLDGRGQPDLDACRIEHDWDVRRFWPDRPDWRGNLVRLEGGAFGMHSAGSPDEPVRRFHGQVFRPGEYLSLQQPGGGHLVFRIVSVEAA
ncbi:MAG: hypothetical protein ACREF3_16605 [Acetobacteraceae bacterium]